MKEEIIRIIQDNTVIKEKVNIDNTLDELGIDSLQMMEIIVQIEKKCDTKFAYYKLKNIKTVKDLLEAIKGE